MQKKNAILFKLIWYNKGFCPLKIEITQFPDFLFSHDVTAAMFVYKNKPVGIELFSHVRLRANATTPNIVAPTMLEVVACVLAVVCKRMQQLPTMLVPGKDTTHKSLQTMRNERAWPQHCWKSWKLLAEKFDRFQTLRNNTQQHPTTSNRMCKWTQHVTSNNVGSCWPTMLRPFAWGFKPFFYSKQFSKLLTT